jgi:hypothetical protein
MTLLNDGLNAMVPEIVPANVPVPALGTVWLMVSVNVTPAGKLVSPQVERLQDALNVPRSTSEPDKNELEPTGTNVSVKLPNPQVVPVHPPLKAPVVEKATVCAAAGTDPRANAAVPMSAARAIPRTPMIPPAACRCRLWQQLRRRRRGRSRW